MSVSNTTRAGQPRVPSASSTEQVACSGRVPLFLLFASSALWLVAAAILSLIGSIKFHSPNFLADSAWLTYGRVRPAFTTALVHGFLVQAALAITTWIFSRLGTCRVAVRPLAIAGWAVLNLGVLSGVIGILAGDASGFEWFEFPGYAAGVYLAGYLAIGISAALTFHQRADSSDLYVSHWFLLAALLWLPWIFSSAWLLLTWSPGRGVSQAAVAWWHAGNLRVVWLWLFSLGVLFYFLPKLSRRDLHSRYLALVAFWALVICGSWIGIPGSAPVPSWMPVASRIGSFMTVVVLVAVYLNLSATMRGGWGQLKEIHPSVRYFTAAYVLLLVLNAAEIVTAFSNVEPVIAFTWFVPAEALANFAGLGALVVFGAAYHILPRLFGTEWRSNALVGAQRWLTVVGLVLWLLPQAVGGVFQGMKLQNPGIAFLDTSRGTLHFLRISTMGELLFLIGSLLFAYNIISMAGSFYKQRAKVFSAEAVRDLRLAREVSA